MIRQLRVKKNFNFTGFTVVYDEIFYHMFRTNVLRATAAVVEPNLMREGSVVFAMAQDKTGRALVHEGKLRNIKNVLYKGRKYKYYRR